MAKGKTNKAVGEDLVSFELIRTLCEDPITEQAFLDWMERIRCGEEMPRQWLRTVVTLLPKSDKPRGPKDLRPISVGASAAKVFGTMLLARTRKYISPAGSSQCAHSGRQTTDYLYAAVKTFSLDTEWRMGLCWCKIDIQKAFDTLSRDKTLGLLRDRLPPEMFMEYRCWERLFFQGTAVLKTPWGDQEVPQGRGIRQGSVESPFLFAIAIEMAVLQATKHEEWPSYIPAAPGMPLAELMYMDDTILWAANLDDMKKKYNILKEELHTWGLKVNPEKTSIYLSPHSTVQGPITLDDQAAGGLVSYLQYAGMAAGGKVGRASNPLVVYRAGCAGQSRTMHPSCGSAIPAPGYPKVVGPAPRSASSGWLKVCALLRNRLMHALTGNGAPKAGKGSKGKSKSAVPQPLMEDPWAQYRAQHGMPMPSQPAQVPSSSDAKAVNLQKWSRLIPVEVFTAVDAQDELPILVQSDFGSGATGVVCIDLSELSAALSVTSPHPLALLVGGSLRRQREKTGLPLRQAGEYTGLFRDPHNGREFEKTFCIHNLGGKDVVMRRRKAEVTFADSTMIDLLLKVVPAPTSSWNAVQVVEDKPREGFTQVLRQRLGVQGQVQKVMPKRTPNQVHTAVVQVPAKEAEDILKRSGQHGVFLQRFANEARTDCTVIPWCHREIVDVDVIYDKASSLPGFMGLMLMRLRVAGVFHNAELKAARLAFAAVGVTADTAGLQIKQHWLARNCPKSDAESMIKTLLDWGWSAIPLQRLVNKAGDRCQWRLGSEGPPPASRMYLQDQTVVFEPLEFPSRRDAKPQLMSNLAAAPASSPPPPGLPMPPKQTAQPIAPLLQGIPAQASADLKQYVDKALEAQAQQHGAEMSALRQEVSRQGQEVNQKVDLLAGSVQSVSGVAQEAHAATTSLMTMLKELQSQQKAGFERLEGMLPERPRKRPGQEGPDEML